MRGIALLDSLAVRAILAAAVCGMLVTACRPSPPTQPAPAGDTATQIPPDKITPVGPRPGEPTFTPTPPAEVTPIPDASVEFSDMPTPENVPRAFLSLSATELKVGDDLTVTGESSNIGLEKFTVSLSTGGVIITTYQDETSIAHEDDLFEIVSVKGQNRRVSVVLTARQPGTSVIWVSISGEVHEGYPGPAYWSNSVSNQMEVTIAE